MSTDVTIPLDLWDDDGDGVITTWLVSDGATVSVGDLLAEVMTEKIQYEIEAPVAGVLEHKKEEDAIVNKGDVIATIT